MIHLHYSSAILSLLVTGNLSHIFNPWHIIVNFEERTITTKKRNWFLISFDKQVVPFRYIRRIEIDTHLFGADVLIRVYGAGTLLVRCINKNDAETIRKELVDFNNRTPTKGMLI